MKKTQILTFCIALLLLVAVLSFSGCKKDSQETIYSLVGNWTVVVSGSQSNDSTKVLEFTGTINSGSVKLEDILTSGEYTMEGEVIRFSISYGFAAPHFREYYEGQFLDENHLNGTFQLKYNDEIRDTGIFTAQRN